MKKHWTICNAVIMLVGFLAAFTALTFLVQTQYQAEFSKRLDAMLAILQTEWKLNSQKDYNNMVNRTEASFARLGQEVRITILDEDANVMGDSQQAEGGQRLEQNHSGRKEIQQAAKNGKGYDMRLSSSTRTSFYYAAVKVPGGYIRAAIPLSDLDTTLFAIWKYGFFALILGIIIVCAATIWFVTRITEPINRIRFAVKRIEAGDYTSRVNGRFRYEFLDLAKAFNSMADSTETAVFQLRRKQEQLEGVLQGMSDGVLAVDETNTLLFVNQSARSMLTAPNLTAGQPLEGSMLIQKLSAFAHRAAVNSAEVHETISNLPQEKQYTVYAAPMRGQKRLAALLVLCDVTHVHKLEQLRSEFVANVTHELKTPLTSIRGSIELLKSADRDEETRRYFYDVLDIEADRLQNLIDDMLVLSQIEHTKEAPALQRCSVKHALRECAQRAKAAAQKNNVTIEIEADETLFVSCTMTRLQQLFGNLIDNAVKYNTPEGFVRITAQRQRKTAVVKIRDTGIGIPAEHLPRLFERFYRVDSSRSREIGGTGLGLSIVKHLAQLYGGEVGVESTPGKGTTFTVCLPLASQEEEEHPAGFN